MLRTTCLCALTLLMISPRTLEAAVVLEDNFNRADGSLVGTSPTPGPGGAWANHSGTAGDLLITGGQAIVQHGTPSEDANSSFGSFSSGLLSATFDITVTDDTPIAGNDFEYFAHFMEVGTFNFFSRLDIVPATAGGDFTFGIATTSGTAEAIFPSDFSYGQSVNGTLTYDFGTGLSSFSVDNTTITSTTSIIAANLDAFALRQSDSSNNETIAIDNLVVSAVPEPGSLALLGCIAAAAGFRRRRA